jgi:DNA-binding GntR family transcriptional regulator
MSDLLKEKQLQGKARFQSGEAFTEAEIASDLQVSVSRARGILSTLYVDNIVDKVGDGVYKKRSFSALLRRKWV